MQISEANAKAIEAAADLRSEIAWACRFAIVLIGLQGMAIAGALFLVLR